MQKKLIAVAVAGALATPLAFAQTNVTISGLIKSGFEQYKLRDTGATSFSSENRVSDQSSRLIFSGVEDLGGGLKAWFQLDNRFGTDLGGFAATGNTGVGLMGDAWGKLTLGRWDLHYGEFGAIESNRAGSLQTLAGAGIMSQVNGTTIANGTRTPNVVMWDSPNWNGFTARLAYSTNPAGNEGSGANDGSKNGAWTGALRYSNGPIVAGYSHWDSKPEGNATAGWRQKSDRAWGGYTFPMGIKVGLGYDRSKLESQNSFSATDRKRNAWLLPVSYTFGPHAVYLTYARAGETDNVNDSKANQWTVGYDYAFSKRTSVGAYFTDLKNKSGAAYNLFAVPGGNGATAAAAGQDPRQFYVGIAHSF